MEKRLGVPSVRSQIRQTLDQADKNMNMSELSRSLKAQGVEMVPRLTKDQSKIIGVYFEKDGLKISGSKVHKSYSWPQLQKQFDYNKQRDFQAVAYGKEPVQTPTPATPQAKLKQEEQPQEQTNKPVMTPNVAPRVAQPLAPVVKPTPTPPSLKITERH